MYFVKQIFQEGFSTEKSNWNWNYYSSIPLKITRKFIVEFETISFEATKRVHLEERFNL